VVTLAALLLSVTTSLAGPQVIKRIIFKGNHALTADELRKAMILKEGSEYDTFLLEKDIDNILELYDEKGFPDAKIVEQKLIPKDGLVECEFLINEGERIKIGDIQILGNEAVLTKEIANSLGFSEGDAYDPGRVSVGEYRIESLYADRGYMYADAKSRAIRENRVVNVTFAIEEGPQVRIGDIRVVGNAHTRTMIIEREIIAKSGEAYDPRKIYRSQERLYATNLFRDVDFDILGAEDSAEVVDIVFRVTELSPRWISFAGGYQSPDRILANIRVGHDNLFNNGQKLSISTFFSYSLEEEHEEQIGLDYVEPYFMNTPFKLMLRIFHSRETRVSYSQWETGANMKIGRYITHNVGFFVQYQYKTAFIDTLEGSVEGITNSILFHVSRDTRDDLFNPMRGTYTSLGLETAGGILGGDNQFARSLLDVSAFVNPLNRFVLGARIRFGELSPAGVSEQRGVSLNERFELGGGASVRGYDEASIGPLDARKKRSGYVMTNLNTELRFPAYKKLWLGLFIDSGGVWMDRNEIELSDLKLTYGVGLRYSLPMGPLRIDYARRLTDVSPGDYGRLYLAIGHIF